VSAGLHRVVPALPVRDVPAAVAHYGTAFGFRAGHESDDFAVLVRDEAVVNLWQAGDASWADRADLAARPVVSGAESFLAGTATDFGTREFATLDLDGNLLSFFRFERI
jgi:lipid-binding SYLF domain-containing protein